MRAFNRFYTNLIGALDYSRHLHTPYTLTEARVLYELVHAPRTDSADLRAALSVDAGQLSRMLARFEERGLVSRRPSARDARRVEVTLTADGREAAGLLEERAQTAVESLLEGMAEAERERLAESLRTARRILEGGADAADSRGGTAARVRIRAPRPGDMGWIIERNASVYAEEFGWDETYEALVARIVAEFAGEHDPVREAAWIAELDGRRAGCVMCVADAAEDTARLRLLLVDPAARGHGLGDRLVAECVTFARAAGYRELVLWTNDVLAAARRIYQRAGFELVGEDRHRSFGHELTGQDWRLAL
ncbi:bifunctional helix-turn-helix transcriptional regulator/GNAT family N-acetyltransferase [Streptomyces marispadix]|uniref:Bifunctional helix-turn-helix transcriptional regulator/GNAT family N-acetyltransferase n=1 Tax=Streptomyces marispadix TaxID=2922868 RepID=A0ABS9T1E7_9ACTN|nr:bifunctional helix-turn-helix transcriptional regulator/GNAT family N-acetyltransferase [Streptomyces marispadix]MCH6162356.1 bifunctional helix-turn-helix transcriptional regulator/GNAT family N-acetyltransferase [Streptomyces marispadix]